MKQHTNEEIMEFFDIKPGDRFKYEDEIYTAESVINFSFYLECKNNQQLAFTTCEEIQEKIEALPRIKRFGDMTCRGVSCSDCPLNLIRCCDYANLRMSLLDIYNAYSSDTGYHIPELETKLNEEVK